MASIVYKQTFRWERLTSEEHRQMKLPTEENPCRQFPVVDDKRTSADPSSSSQLSYFTSKCHVSFLVRFQLDMKLFLLVTVTFAAEWGTYIPTQWHRYYDMNITFTTHDISKHGHACDYGNDWGNVKMQLFQWKSENRQYCTTTQINTLDWLAQRRETRVNRRRRKSAK